MWFFPQFSRNFPQFAALWNWFVSCKEASFPHEVFWKKTYVLLKTCESSPILPKKFSFSTGFFLQPFVSQYEWLRDMIWVGLLQDQFFPKHHHWLNIMRIWQLDTLAHYIQIISFSYSLTSVCFQKKATEKPRKNWLRKVFHKTLREHRVFWTPPWSNDIPEHWDS